MILWGVSIPPLAVAVGTIITAFIAGLGLGLGSETGKYLMERYLRPKYEKLHNDMNKIHDKVLKPLVHKSIGKPNSKILSRAFKSKDSKKDTVKKVRVWKSKDYINTLAKNKKTAKQSKKAK